MSAIIVKQGQLEKEGGGALTRWQPRWFVLTSSDFSWFKVDDLRNAQGSFAVSEITGTEKQLGERQGRKNVFTVSTGRKSYQLAAPSREERDEWLLALSPASHAEYAAKAAAGSSSKVQVPVKKGAETDEVLERVKKAAKQMAEQKGGEEQRRDTILIPLNQSAQSSSATSPAGASSATELAADGKSLSKRDRTAFAVVEVFISHGLRISGSVPNQMYTMLGQGVSNDRKHLDKRGWFCDRSFNLCQVMQTFGTSGWYLYRISQSVSFTPWDNSLVPINLLIFVRGPGAEELTNSSVARHSFDSVTRSLPSTMRRSGTVVAGKPGSVPLKDDPSLKLLDGGENAELQELMQQFNIPLSLLYVKT